jgi:hypothetical protein
MTTLYVKGAWKHTILRAVVRMGLKWIVFFSAFLILTFLFRTFPHEWDSFDVAVIIFLILIYMRNE